MPALWEEPFGLTLIEAMFSGTPVPGHPAGALPGDRRRSEVGELGDTLEELVELAPRAEQKDPDACRARALSHFSHLVMAERYVACYTAFLRNGTLEHATAPSGPSALRSADGLRGATDPSSISSRITIVRCM